MSTQVTDPGVYRREAVAVDWETGIQWKPVVAGALAGFAATLILSNLGAAIGLTAADATDAERSLRDVAAIGAGAMFWWILTVAVAGLVGGWVISYTARHEMGYYPVIYGTLAWVMGVIILLILLAIGLGTTLGGVASGLGSAMAERGGPSMSPADSATAIERAGDVWQGMEWGMLISQLVGLGATILAASMGGRRARLGTRREAV